MPLVQEERTILDQVKDELKQWNIASMQSEAVAMSECMLGMLEQMEGDHDAEDEIVQHMVSMAEVFVEYAQSFIDRFGTKPLEVKTCTCCEDSDCLCSIECPVHGIKKEGE